MTPLPLVHFSVRLAFLQCSPYFSFFTEHFLFWVFLTLYEFIRGLTFYFCCYCRAVSQQVSRRKLAYTNCNKLQHYVLHFINNGV